MEAVRINFVETPPPGSRTAELAVVQPSGETRRWAAFDW
jgi:hypothetical protein